MYQGSPLSPISLSRSFHRHSYAAQGHLHISIQSNLDLPRTRIPLTSAIYTLLAIRHSSILSTCTNHLNTLWYALLANSLFHPALLLTSSFLTPSIRDTPKTSQTLYLKNIHFPSLSTSHPQASDLYNAVCTIIPP